MTELLSGRFYQVLGRSTAHQLWSSAMVISPVLRGMFGLEWDESRHQLSVSPRLPADWDTAAIHRLPFGNTRVDLTMRSEGQTLVIAAGGPGAKGLHLTSQTEGARERNGELRLPVPPVEIYTGHQLPPFGAETRQMKVLAETYEGRLLKVVLSAPGGTVQSLGVRVNGTGVHPSFENTRATPIRNGTGQSHDCVSCEKRRCAFRCSIRGSDGGDFLVMQIRRLSFACSLAAAGLCVSVDRTAFAQQSTSIAADVTSVDRLAWSTESRGAHRFLAVHGRRALMMGYPAAGLEVWAYPLQLVSHYQVSFVPRQGTHVLNGLDLLQRVEYRPDEVSRTYVGPDFVRPGEHLCPPE